jgi:hypothetical protein
VSLEKKTACPFTVQGLDLTEEICFLRERERVCVSEIGFSKSLCVFSVGSRLTVLLVWHIVSLVRHAAPCS